jgi:peptidoglycan hydrolase CwlO-like protein
MSISPNVPEPSDPTIYEAASTPRWIFVVFIAAFALIGYLFYTGSDARTKLETELSQANSKQTVLSAQIDQTNSVVADLRGKLEVTTQKLGFTQAELAQARSLAQNIRESQKESDEKLTAQIGQAKQEAEAKIGQVSTDLNGAKGDITATRQDLEATKGQAHQHGGRPRRAERIDRAQPGGTGPTKAPGRTQYF